MKRTLLLFACLLLALAPAEAARLFQVTVATDPGAGVLGYQLAGFGDPASVRIFDFQGGSTSVFGVLPPSAAVNGTDDYQLDKNNDGDELLLNVTGLGNSLNFRLLFTGFVDADPFLTDWNTFGFSFYSDDTLTSPPAGFGPNPLLVIELTQPLAYSADPLVSLSEVPEPATAWIALLGLAAIGWGHSMRFAGR